MPGIIASLTAEWDALCQRTDSDTTNQRMQIWAQREPALAQFTTMGEIATTTDNADQVLAALIRLGQGHNGHAPEPDALRAVLQQVLKWLSKMGRYIKGVADYEENCAALITEAWEHISTYSLDRHPTSIHGHIGYDALTAVRRQRGATVPLSSDPTDIENEARLHHEGLDRTGARLVDTPYQAPTFTAAGVDVDSSYEEVLQWALDNNIIDHDRAELLRDTYLPHQRGIDVPPHFLTGSVAAAEKRGIRPDHARQLCKRANDKIKAALHAHAA